MDLDGLKTAILRMMDGEEVLVSVSMYENNLNKIEWTILLTGPRPPSGGKIHFAGSVNRVEAAI